ncbi:MAG: DUF364 domain-containing protein [Desulfarculaceae bacterium]|nr:DUF364 domain-containing protein [Desulfarculaceae bacterium]
MKKPLTRIEPHGSGHHHACCGGPPTPRPALAGLPREQRLLAALLAEQGPVPLTVERLALGRRFLAVQADGVVGLSSTLGAAPAPGEAEKARGLAGAPLGEVAGLVMNDSPWLASLGLAALNAARPAPPEARPAGADELLCELAPGKRVVVVGDFPFTAALGEIAAELDLLELRPGAETPPTEEWEAVLGRSQVAAITSTTLLTRALAWALEAAPQAVRVLVGPSTPWSPVLFSHGADVLAGSRVDDPEAVMEAVAQDLGFRAIKKRGVASLVWAKPGSGL